MSLTDVALRNAKSRDRDYKLSAGDGLYVLVRKNGSKLWRYDYSHLGKRQTLALGQYPEVGLRRAREKLLEARGLLADGVDPNARKKEVVRAAKLAANSTFRALCEEWLETLKSKGLAEITIWKKRWILIDLVCPEIGHRPIAEIRAAEILGVLRKIEASGRLETARRARQNIGLVFRYAGLTERVDADPTTLLHRDIRPPKVEHHPAIIYKPAFGALLRKIDGYSAPTVRNALIFMALTFVRPVELRLAQWSEFDLEEGKWSIPAEHTKMRRPHDVPLTAAMLTILREMAVMYGREGYVFPSPFDRRKPISENTMNKALWLLGYKRKHTAHGFRSSASTILNESKRFRQEVIEFQLNHLDESETKRAYNRAQYWEERIHLMREWSKMVTELRTPP